MSGAAPSGPGPRDHYVLAGGGTTARVILDEILRTGRRCTVVESRPEACASLRDLLPPECILEADATEEEALRRAGTADARAVLATLQDDKLNLVVTVTARQIRPGIRVIARGNDPLQWPRLRRAGAVVVSSSHIGGRRLAAAMIHTETTVFLNEMLTAPSEKPIRVEAVVVTEEKRAVGRTLTDLDVFRHSGLQVIALCHGPEGEFTCNPGGSVRLEAGDRLVVIGDFERVNRLAALVGRWE